MYRRRNPQGVGVKSSTKGILIVAGVVIVIVAVALAVASGSSSSPGASASDPSTALGNLAVAQSALATTAPDAKLLVVQMAESATTTSSPTWEFLFGSPETDMGYLVYAADGAVMTSMEYGTLGLSADEWSEVPDLGLWKVDSSEAYDKALAASGASGTPTGYFMGFLTYLSAEDTSTVDAFQWNVWFDPGSSGATENLILVDTSTGKTTVTDSP
jgi:hypothetical protein